MSASTFTAAEAALIFTAVTTARGDSALRDALRGGDRRDGKDSDSDRPEGKRTLVSGSREALAPSRIRSARGLYRVLRSKLLPADKEETLMAAMLAGALWRLRSLREYFRLMTEIGGPEAGQKLWDQTGSGTESVWLNCLADICGWRSSRLEARGAKRGGS